MVGNSIFYFFIIGLINSKLLYPSPYLGKIWSHKISNGFNFFYNFNNWIIFTFNRKDLLNIKLNNNKTYWIDKKPGSMKRQF